MSHLYVSPADLHTGKAYYVTYTWLPMTTLRCPPIELCSLLAVTTSTLCLRASWRNRGRTEWLCVRSMGQHWSTSSTLCTRQRYELPRITYRCVTLTPLDFMYTSEIRVAEDRCVMLVWRKGNINKNCLCVTVGLLCTIIMVHKDMSSSYRSVDCIGLWSCLV